MWDEDGRLPSNMITDAWVAANQYIGSAWDESYPCSVHKDLDEDTLPWRKFYDDRYVKEPFLDVEENEGEPTDIKQKNRWEYEEDQKEWDYDMNLRKKYLTEKHGGGIPSQSTVELSNPTANQTEHPKTPEAKGKGKRKRSDSEPARKPQVRNTRSGKKAGQGNNIPAKTPVKNKKRNKKVSSGTIEATHMYHCEVIPTCDHPEDGNHEKSDTAEHCCWKDCEKFVHRSCCQSRNLIDPDSDKKLWCSDDCKKKDEVASLG